VKTTCANVEAESSLVENILLVDDNIHITWLMEKLLNQFGNVDIAHNGQDALKQIKRKFYKLIITDIEMPRMNGIDLFNNARARYPGIESRFLFISGGISSEKQHFFANNNLNYLQKPCPNRTLTKAAVKIIFSNT
jgi:DNA-binding NtrC family response regulator